MRRNEWSTIDNAKHNKKNRITRKKINSIILNFTDLIQ